uniref:Uncharacterized protein n=1 Tax=Acrobeloides nanus TaxID=290746 RepID=A0A914DTP7_9BILA
MAYNSPPPYGNQQQYPQQYLQQNPSQPYPNQQSYPNQNQNVGWNQNISNGGQQNPTAPPQNIEDGLPKANFGFNEKSIRQAFIRKVFILVTIMLAIVAIMTAIPFIDTSKNFKNYIQHHVWIYYVSYAAFIVVYLLLICVETIRRSFPVNIIFAGILTLSIGYMTMMITAMYTVESVLICLVILTISCAVIIIFASQTKIDFTSKLGYIFVFGLFVFILGIVAVVVLVVFKVHWLYMVYAGLAAILFMFYLAIDVQMIMGGKKYEVSSEDYIFAAIQIRYARANQICSAVQICP